MKWLKVVLFILVLSFSAKAQDQIWANYTPTNPDANGTGGAVELGVQFSSDVAGTVTAIRFYKSAANTGTHTGTIWSSSGTALETVTFSGETASGWQQMNFPTPVTIAANTTYTMSYHTTVDDYSADFNFPWPVYNAPLHGLAGTYTYGSNTVFPTSIYMGTNYAIDLVFSPAGVTLSSIAITPSNPSVTAGATQQFTATGTYSNGGTQNITSQVTWLSASTNIATIGSGGLAAGVTAGTSSITASMGGVTSPIYSLTVTAGSSTCTCAPQVVLSWAPVSGATAYNVLRGTVSGGPYAQIASVPSSALAYTDMGVTSGSTYFYVIAYVIESAATNLTQVQVTIPTP